MNKIFKVIWNHATQSWIVTSEISKSHGKTASGKSGGFAISHISGVRFAYTAIASTLLFVLSETTLAATVADGTGTNSIIIKGATSTATAIGADSLAAGTNAAANGKSAVAIGTNSEATGENATAYGNMATATKNNATAFGSLSQATAQSATAVGHKSQATADHATALGSIANASAARTVAVGYNVTASQIDAVAVGSNAIANQANAVAVGVNAKAQNNSNIAIGNLANATGATSAISIGRESVASNTSTVAMGYKAQASGTSAIAVGSGSLASGISAIAIGNGSDAAGERTTVIGSRNGNVAASYSAIVGIGNAITSTTDVQVYGNTNTISRSNTYVLGSNNTVSGATESAVIAGRQNTMSGTNGVAVGRLNTVAGSSAVAIGQSSQALGTDGIALGNKAYANTGQNAIALGGLTYADQFGTALGARTSVKGDQGLAAATGAVVEGPRAVAVGSYSFAGPEDAVALGHNTAATGSRAVAIGAGSVVSGARSGAWGIATNGGQPQNNTTDRSFVGGADSYAIGNKNIIGNTSSDSFVLGNNVKLGATGASIAITNVAGKDGTTNASTRTNTVNYTGATAITGAVALGSDTSVTVNNGVALGKSSVAGTAAGQVGTDPLSAVADKTGATWTSTLSAVSVGDFANNKTRQITSVAAGTQDTDAVNVAQLKAAGFTLAASNTGGGEATTVADDKIQNGETVTVDAGKNIKVTHTANTVSIATKDDVAFTTVTTTDAAGNKTVLNGTGITITPTGAANPVSLTNAGLNNGGNVISNVGAGKASTDAVNVSQLTPLATALGVNVDPNSGIVAAPSFVVTKTDGSTYAGETTIQGALNNIGTEIQKGITFTGNSGQAVKRLGETFNIKGTLSDTATASDKNIRTEVDSNGVMSIKLAESPKFGNVTINDAGKITGVTAGTANTDAVNVAQLNNKTATTPLTVGNTGAVDTPADTSKLATAGDIANAINNAGFTLTTAKTTDGELGATATNELINAGDTVTVEADKNIKVTQTNGKISIATKDVVSFNSVTAGTGTNAVVLDDKGVNVGGKTYISDAGLNANSKVITNVADGTADKDAVNVSQLKAAQAAATSKVEGDQGVTVTSSANNDGTTTYTVAAKTDGTTIKVDSNGNLTANTTTLAPATDGKVGTPTNPNALVTASDIANAINNSGFNLQANGDTASLVKAGDKVQFLNGDNIEITRNGNDITVATAKDVSFNSVTAGTGTNQAVLDNDGVKVGGNTYISNAGLNANDKKVTNVANGDVTSASKDAINGSQLHAVSTATKNLIGGNATVNSDGTVTASNIGGTGATTIDNAIKTVKTTVKSTDNTIKVTANPADATNGTVFDISVDSQKLAESAQLPVVYTDADGNKVYKVGGKFTKDPTGQDATKEVSAANVIASMQNADGTISPTTLANIKAGIKATDAVNVSQLKGAVDALGGGATINADGTIKAPTYSITNPANGKVTTANNVGDALKGLNDAVNSPLTFKGDSGEFNRNLGQTTTVKGGITDTAKLSDNNIGVVAKDGTLDIKLAKDIALDSVTTGNTLVDNSGITIKVPTGGTTSDVKLTAGGLDNGGNKITNIAEGTNATDAVNKGQLDKAQAAATTKVTNGKNVTVAEQTNADGSKTYTVATADDVAFNKVTVGGVVVDGTSNKISGLANGEVSARSTDAINGSQLFATNQNVANNAAAIANNAALIAKGINFGGTTGSNNYALGDTINVKGDSNISSETVAGGVQLKLSDVISVGTAKPVKIDGTKGTVGGLTNTAWDANNIVSGQAATEDQLKSAVSAAQAAATTKVAEGKNIKVTEQPNADGSTTYTVATADDLDVTSVKAGDTTINNAGVTVGDKVALTNTGLTAGDVKVSTDGINAGNKAITGVAAGTKDTDAVNVKQLNDQLTATEKTTTAQAGSDKVTVTGTTTGNNTDYVIDLSQATKASLAKADTALQNVVSTDPNLTVSKNGDTVTLDFSDAPVFAGVTAGSGANQVVLDNDGVKVGGNTYISNAGLNANDKKITNVVAGTVAKDSKDAINGSQLFAQGEGVKNIIGGNTTYDPATGTYTNNNIGGTGKGNINDAIQAINNTANAGWNVQTNGRAKTNIKPTDTVNFINGKNIKVTNEGANITVATADDLDVTSVKAGNTTINNAGVTVGDKVALTESGLSAGDVKVTTGGINAGGNKITGVAAGDISATSTDAVNGSQLNAVNQRILNIIGGKDDGYYDANGNLTEAGQLALKTYNVQGQSEFVHNSVVSAIKNINEQGTKFFHTNEGQSFTSEATNSEDSSAGGKYSTAIGYQAATTAEATNGLAVGTQSKAAGENAVALGYQAQANGTNTISIGTGNIVNGNNSGAIGDPSVIDGANSYSVGNNNSIAASSDNVFILGNDVNIAANTSGAVALGNKASVTTAGSVALGEGSTAGAANIAGGTANNAYTFGAYNDANVAAKPTTSTSVVAVGSKGNERQIQHVAAGVVSATSTDAINGSQLYYTNRALGKLADVVNKNNLDLRAGIAGANAAAGLPQVYLPGKSMVAASAGTYRGQSALAVGYSRSSDNGKLVLKVQGNANTRGEVGGSVGIGYQW